MLQEELTKRPGDWQTFLTNDENKLQLTRLVLRIWNDDEVADKYKSRKVSLIAEGRILSGQMNSNRTPYFITVLKSETDSMIVLYS